MGNFRYSSVIVVLSALVEGVVISWSTVYPLTIMLTLRLLAFKISERFVFSFFTEKATSVLSDWLNSFMFARYQTNKLYTLTKSSNLNLGGCHSNTKLAWLFDIAVLHSL